MAGLNSLYETLTAQFQETLKDATIYSPEKHKKQLPRSRINVTESIEVSAETSDKLTPPTPANHAIEPRQSWIARSHRPKKLPNQHPHISTPLDWSLARPAIDMTTPAPDPANVLATQILKMESTLNLLETKTRFQEEIKTKSAGTRPTLGHSLPHNSLYSLILTCLFLLITMRSASAYSYEYFDCAKPSGLQTFDRLELCSQPTSGVMAGQGQSVQTSTCCWALSSKTS